jgi:hypothetical protein
MSLGAARELKLGVSMARLLSSNAMGMVKGWPAVWPDISE